MFTSLHLAPLNPLGSFPLTFIGLPLLALACLVGWNLLLDHSINRGEPWCQVVGPIYIVDDPDHRLQQLHRQHHQRQLHRQRQRSHHLVSRLGNTFPTLCHLTSGK